MLSDGQIKRAMDSGQIGISPFDLGRLGPASYDLLLDGEVRLIQRTSAALDLSDFEPGYSYAADLRDKGGIILPPGGCMLASTQEIITVDSSHGCQIEGRSSMARLFQQIHVTAGWCDPGWSGRVTLEIINHLPRPVIYRYGMKVAQALFFAMARPAEAPYEVSGQYQHQNTVTEANPIKIYLEETV